MGLAASQARLLSITARLTHNETQSQLITNAKLRLADKSSEASQEYLQALNTTQFTYMNYDTNGLQKSQDFTFGAVTQYSDIKNQYGFIDAQGRLLVSGEDARNYEKSNTLADFLACYNIGDMENPQRAYALTNLYGDNYNDWHDDGNPKHWLNSVNGATRAPIGDMITNNGSGVPQLNWNIINDEAAYEEWKQSVIDACNGSQGTNQPNGIYNSWLDEIKDIPDYIEKPVTDAVKPTPPTPPNPDDYTIMESFVDAVKKGGCYSLAEAGRNCYMHVLSDMLGPGSHTTSSGVTFEVTSTGGWNWNYASPSHTYDGQIGAIREIIKTSPTANNPNQTIYQKIVDFLWNTHTSYEGWDSSSPSATGGDSLPENKAVFDEIIDVDLASIKNTNAWDEALDLYEKEMEEYQKKLDEYNEQMKEYEDALKNWQTNYVGQLETWAQNIQEREENYNDAIENLPPATIPDENDPKYQWYVNLWFRMGGISNTAKQDNKNNYKVLEEEFVNNRDWLKFALEHGIVTMEQVQYQEEGDVTNPVRDEMNHYSWISIQYGTCAELYEESDELAIAKAEIKYQKTTAEIQAKDKKYDNDLKKLDSTHNALQTEYDSIKSVIEKNTERSFKAFS